MKRLSVACLLLFVVSWPPVYSIYVHPRLNLLSSKNSISNDEIKQLLDARRYTIRIPEAFDGWFLTFHSTVDGKPGQPSSGGFVRGGEDVVLILRRNTTIGKVEYCWYGKDHKSHGVLDDPLVGVGVLIKRSEGPVEDGDWLLRGGRKRVDFMTDETADFELRLALSPPVGPSEN